MKWLLKEKNGGGLDSKNMTAFGKVSESKIGKIFSEKDPLF